MSGSEVVANGMILNADRHWDDPVLIVGHRDQADSLIKLFIPVAISVVFSV
jgi:hypothetical protein